MPRTVTDEFAGRIAGLGTAAGIRLVVGLWETSPFGPATDVMVETADGHRVLLAPTRELADYIATTYEFDEVRVVPVARRAAAAWVAETTSGGRPRRGGERLVVDAGDPADPGRALHLELEVGGRTGLGRVLRAVPRGVAVRPWWLSAISPVATFLRPGVATAGSAGGGRREYYGVTDVRGLIAADGRFDGQELEALAPLHPPVRFGFASAPREPSVVDVTTTIRRPAARV